MADVTTTGKFIGTGTTEPVTITVTVTDNEEVVENASVVLAVSPADLTSGAERRVEAYLSAADAAALARILLDFAESAQQAVDEGDEVSGDYSG